MILLNGTRVVPTMFPDKTSQVWQLGKKFPEMRYAQIEWQFEHEGEFMHLAQLHHLLKVNHISASLYLSYLPYGRQDKEISNTTTFALYTFADLLNYLNFDRVLITDPHSKQFEMINNSEAVYPWSTISMILDREKMDLVCYPDKGAVEKYTKHFTFKYVHGEKGRDQLTGQIKSYSIHGDVKYKKVLIVDDICDGGATFTALAELLYFNGAKEVQLYVTHGIFSKGTQLLKDANITKIHTYQGGVQ